MKSKRLLAVAAALVIFQCGCQDEIKKQAALMTGGNPELGRSDMSSLGCGSCHTIPGVPGADALVGPPLSRVAARGYIGGVLRNTPENMVRWLKDPPGVDPLTAMPNLRLTDSQVRDLAGYLYTLR